MKLIQKKFRWLEFLSILRILEIRFKRVVCGQCLRLYYRLSNKGNTVILWKQQSTEIPFTFIIKVVQMYISQLMSSLCAAATDYQHCRGASRSDQTQSRREDLRQDEERPRTPRPTACKLHTQHLLTLSVSIS